MINLTLYKKQEKQDLDSLLQEYLTELSHYSESKTDLNGRMQYPFLDLYWVEENRFPLKILLNNNVVGFILINDHCIGSANKSIAEFYIKPEFRRRGYGRKAVIKMFAQYTGNWEIKYHNRNRQAETFWISVIAQISNGLYHKEDLQDKAEECTLIYFSNV